MNNYPLVSVIIPTYKRSDMLPRAIQSVFEQSYANMQIVVVDDNDPNTQWRKETAKIMDQFAEDKRVKYVCHEKNKNGSAARNTGIREADGEIICFLDDDDWFLPLKTERQVKFLMEHPEHRAVYCGWNRDDVIFNCGKEGNLSYELLSGTQLIYTNVIMMWREDALNCGGWDETFRRHQEAAFMLRYFRSGGTVGFVPEVLVEFDVSDRSNAAGNSVINEEQLNHYLSSYKDMIADCEQRNPGAAKNIYSYRYRGALLHHVKGKNWKQAWRLYIKMVKAMPLKFNADLFRYVVRRYTNERTHKGKKLGQS